MPLPFYLVVSPACLLHIMPEMKRQLWWYRKKGGETSRDDLVHVMLMLQTADIICSCIFSSKQGLDILANVSVCLPSYNVQL